MLLFIMDKFVVIEVGSTNTKSCLYESGAVIEFPQKLIMFKDKAISNNLPESAVAQLIDYVNSFKDKTENIFILFRRFLCAGAALVCLRFHLGFAPLGLKS